MVTKWATYRDRLFDRDLRAQYLSAFRIGGRWFSVCCLVIAAGVALCLLSGSPVVAEAPGEKHTNRLINSGNPYLLQHAHNPVDWYPWGSDAIAAAKRENKLIFLSVGYSTCYWCHVADRTLYSDPKIAALMNKWFINIKVDREERPDVDETYMLARQLLAGSGGWPNNVFLTPDLKPFFAGSYFPPEDQPGATGFPGIMKMLAETWETNPDKILGIGDDVHRVLMKLRDASRASASVMTIRPDSWLEKSRLDLLANVDKVAGGFSGGGGTKFPRSPLLGLLIVDYRLNHTAPSLQAVAGTLEAIALGGIHDQLGGGIHRYSTEPTWSVPHFEKMLYDNGQLIGLYADLYESSRDPLARVMAADIADYLARRLSAPDGGFYTAEDADIDGVEGKSYTWKKAEIEGVLGRLDAKRFFEVYELVGLPGEQGGPGVLRVRKSSNNSGAAQIRVLTGIRDLALAREKLLAVRDLRRQPARDEKIVVGINGIAISGLARAGKVFRRAEWIAAASKTGEFLWREARDEKTGLLCRYIFDGKPFGNGFLEDYAHLGLGYVTLFEVTGDDVWMERAQALASVVASRFVNGDGVVVTTTDDLTLIVPAIDMDDGDTPSGTSAAYRLMARLGERDVRFSTTATKILAWVAPKVDTGVSDWPALVASAALFGSRVDVGGARVLDSASHVSARAVGASKEGSDEILVTLTVATGYHVNANPASSDNLIATTVKVPGFETSARITYPPGQLFKPKFSPEGISVFEGDASIKIALPGGSVEGLKGKSVSVVVQACNNEICLPPATLSVPLE